MGAHRCVVCLGVVTGVLTIVCVVLAGILIWREEFVDRVEQLDGTFVRFDTTNMTAIQTTFPGYFTTPEEQRALTEANEDVPRFVRNVSRVYERCFTNGFCERVSEEKPITTTQFSAGGRRKRRQVNFSQPCTLDVLDEDELTFHGCCISYSNLETPPVLETAEPGRSGNVQIAQFPLLRQYFEIQYCCQAASCTGCQCAQTYYVVSAVVGRRTNGGTVYSTEYVRVPGCCKCLNTTPAEGNANQDGGLN